MRRWTVISGFLVCWAWLSAAPAWADDRQACLTVSFAPLEDTLPACDRLLESLLDQPARLQALMARAEARRWALTYHHGREIDDTALLTAMRQDLDLAVTLARELDDKPALRLALRQRAEALMALGDNRAAVADYTAAMALSSSLGAPLVEELMGRSLAYERQTYVNLAVADMTLLILIRGADPNLPNWLIRRAELHVLDHDPEAARIDYRQALSLAPGNQTARQGLERLGR